MKTVFLTFNLVTALLLQAQPKVSIIPLPKVIVEKTGSFAFNNKTSITYNQPNIKKLAVFAQASLKQVAGIKTSVQTNARALAKTNSILLQLDAASPMNAEGYVLDVSPTNITIKAATENGLFYGLQSLVQIVPLQRAKKVASLHIEDEPRFTWRGMMMDVCRHTWSVDFIKKFIDQLAFHKLNKFHWHLTEDQGWRIEIKKYPRLQEVAAWRNGTQVGYDRKKTDSIRYGGYYTQEQIKDVVAYAASRYVEVIPEIEMPGHSVAAVTAYPNLACNAVSFETGKPHEVRQVWGVSKDIYCAGNDSVFTFLQDVLTEVMSLFPSKYIHIGGDEAPHEAWAKCAKCQQRMKDNGLKNEAELQSWFIRRMEKFINANGKKLIGWEEIMEGGLTSNATVQSWLGVRSGLKAAQMGNDAIMSPYSHLYFDGYQAEPKIEPKAIGYFTPLDTVYAFEPRHPQMTDEDAKHLLGAQANVWTEFISTEDYFQYMVFPRMDALAEISWSPKERKNFTDFKQRLKTQLLRYDRKNINYRIPVPVIQASYNVDSTASVQLENLAASGVIRYEINQEKVTAQSPIYEGVINVKKGELLQFASFIENGRQSSTDYFPKKSKKK
jgi:hexosaminidase